MINLSISLKENSEIIATISEIFKDYKVECDDPYVSFRAKKGSLVISIYKNKEDKFTTLLFQGDETEIDPELRDTLKIKVEKEVADKPYWLYLGEQIGSDEVGCGDLFAPISVCAAYVDKDDIPYLQKLKVTDSKKFNSNQILIIGAHLIRHVKYSLVSITNEKYNSLIDQGENLNSIKARLHNAALCNLKKRYPEVDHIFMDEFVREQKYYEYLKKDNEIVRGITFKTEGESYFPSVAVASVIARYSLLKKMKKMDEQYGFHFPLGSSNSKIDQAMKDFAQQFGEEELEKVVKKNFKNYVQFLQEKSGLD